jgi:Xaa-Pro dipeptidase
LLFAQESLYYLTGFDTSGFVFFQCAVLTAGADEIVLLTRRPDLEQARRTSTIPDVRLWYDGESADPSVELKAILEEKKLGRARIGIELRTFGLTADKYDLVRAGGCLAPGPQPAGGEVAGRDRLRAPSGGAGRPVA